MSKKSIIVLFGGCSSEYEVSLISAVSIMKAINSEKYQIIKVGITKEGEWKLFEGKIEEIQNSCWEESKNCFQAFVSLDKSNPGIYVKKERKVDFLKFDMALPILHGKNGEDGTVQGVFELMGIPIVGCNTLSSALCMDKYRAHKLVAAMGIDVPKSILINRKMPLKEIYMKIEKIGYPVFVKPLRSGSSFGITKVLEAEALPDALEKAYSEDGEVIIEETIEGFEVGCAIMGGSELVIGQVDEIELSEGFFDYEEKYSLKSSKIHMPARISKETAEKIKVTAKEIYRILGCRIFARVDMFLSRDNKIYFNEVNTIPGFTSHSRFPNMMKGIGIDFDNLVNMLIEESERDENDTK